MTRIDRLAVIAELEKLRQSRVVTYVTGDRPPAGAQIGDDALRPMYDVLREIGHVSKLDLLIYSRGGALDVPWRIASALRHAADEWNILVPFRANSAATLLALGADQIVLGQQGELGPIDPIMSIGRVGDEGTVVQDTVNVEDIMGFLRFVKDRVGLTDQAMLSASVAALTSRLDAVGLGAAFRTHSHIRDVARRMLTSRKNPLSERVMETIVETLAERVYAHGHAIGYGEAHDIGLEVKEASADEDRLMWAALKVYETDLKLREPIDPMGAVAMVDRFVEPTTLAVIDSVPVSFACEGELEVKAKRLMPPNFNVAVNLMLQLPPQPPANPVPQLPPDMQQAIVQQAQQAVIDALKAQAPLVAAEVGVRGVTWVRYDNGADEPAEDPEVAAV